MRFFNSDMKDKLLVSKDAALDFMQGNASKFFAAAKEMTDRPGHHWNEGNLGKKIAIGTAAAVVILPLTYIAIGQTTGGPDYDATFDNVQAPKGSAGSGSKFVAVLSAMVKAELSNGWCPSKTIFNPSGMRTDTCAYQMGQRELVSQIALSLRNVMAYNGTRTSYDPDLTSAASDMQVHPNMWMPFYGTDAYYGEAVGHFEAYDRRLADGKASFPLRVNDLETAMNDIMRVTGDESDLIKPTVNDSHFFTGEDRATYFRTVGAFKVACELMKAARQDFRQVISNQNATYSFDKATADTCAVAGRPIPNLFYFFKSNLNADKEGMAGAASSAIGMIQKAYNDLAGGPSPRPR